MRREELSVSLRSFCAQHVGTLKSSTFCGWDHAEFSVWRIKGERGEAFLKCHQRSIKFEQELNAYEVWLENFTQTPKLIAVHHGTPKALLVSAVPGDLVQDLDLSEAQTVRVYQQAGNFLGRLHSLDIKDDSAESVQDAVLSRLESWLTKVEGIVPTRDIAFVRAQMTETLPYLKDKCRVPCHRDYTARNWLLDGEDFYVIDFEHGRLDFYLSDLSRQFAEVWRFHPELKKAFLRGYSVTLNKDAQTYLTRVAAFNAAVTIAWARAHGDEGFEQQGWEQLEYYRKILK